MGTATRQAHPKPHRRSAVHATVIIGRRLWLYGERYGSGHGRSLHPLGAWARITGLQTKRSSLDPTSDALGTEVRRALKRTRSCKPWPQPNEPERRRTDER